MVRRRPHARGRRRSCVQRRPPARALPEAGGSHATRVPFVMSTIHHPQEWLARFRRFQPPTGLPGRLLYRSPIGRSIPSSEAIREVAMLVLQRRFRHLGAVVPWWTNRVKWLLANAARIALASPAERIYLERDFAYRCRPEQVLVLPNWVEEAEDVSSSPPPQFQQLPEPPVIVVGRVEPRKNSLRICRLAAVARRHVVFIGRPHPNERVFVAAFRRAADANGYARWVPGVPRPEMAAFYRHSSFLLNASLLEVSPLVDIEALQFGCPVTTTKYALHHDLLPPRTPVCDPYDDGSIVDRLRWRPARLPPGSPVDGERCKQDLVETYRVLSCRHDD
ncbi:MAG: hypothetical protein DMD81_23445 [Candidatus Rokuibacteriota bacterium]|nr:MAG: hypothetical protein DMD81_23445 [Candidatus Rokubacteria bacterium]